MLWSDNREVGNTTAWVTKCSLGLASHMTRKPQRLVQAVSAQHLTHGDRPGSVWPGLTGDAVVGDACPQGLVYHGLEGLARPVADRLELFVNLVVYGQSSAHGYSPNIGRHHIVK